MRVVGAIQAINKALVVSESPDLNQAKSQTLIEKVRPDVA